MNDQVTEEKNKIPAILCVDDEPNILSALKRLLRRDGYRVHVADGGEEGLALLEEEPIDLVISDMRMPEMDGAEFLSKVAKKWPDVMRLLLTGYADLESTIAAVNEGGIYQYLSKPWEDEPLRALVRQALDFRFLKEERSRLEALTKRQNEELRDLNKNLEKKVEARTSELKQTADMLDAAYKAMKRSFTDSVKVFGNLVEMREKRMAGHSRRVARYVDAMTKALSLPGPERIDIHFASVLHDIGKIGFTDAVINAPFESLSTIKRENFMRHPVIAESALLALEPLQGASKIIRSHKELYNGDGFPEGLKANKIPKGARLLAIANDFDELQLGTLVKGIFNAEDASNFILDHKGTRYAPEFVDIFLGVMDNIDDVQDRIDERSIDSDDLFEGMIISRDLVTFSGMLLLTKDHSLNARIIAKIRAFEEEDGAKYQIFVKVE